MLPIEVLIPHRHPMRWIDALISCTDTTASATACFGPDDFAVADSLVLETALVECVAQTVAAAMGQRAQAQDPPGRISDQGALVAISDFSIRLRPPVGKVLQIEVQERKRFDRLLMVSGLIS